MNEVYDVVLRATVEYGLQQDELSQRHFVDREVVDVVEVRLVLAIFPLVLNADYTTLRFARLLEINVITVFNFQVVA